MASEAIFGWALRALWLLLPFVSGTSLADALDGASAAVRNVASLGLWAGWAAGVVALAVPRPIGLTALRVVAPAGALALVAAAFAGHTSVPSLTAGVVAALVSVTPEIATLFANGAAYPNEKRFPLRVPGPLFVGLLPVAWALLVAGIAAGPLLLAAEQWVTGAVAVAAGFPIAAVLLRGLHALSRRWAVLVPAGLVLHDPMTLADPVLFRRNEIEVLHPAPAGSDSLDLTQKAPGLTLELLLREKVPMTLVKPGPRRLDEAGASARLLFTPARPGALLRAAQARRIPVEFG